MTYNRSQLGVMLRSEAKREVTRAMTQKGIIGHMTLDQSLHHKINELEPLTP